MVSQIFYHINNTIIDGEIGMRSFQEYSFLTESKTEQDLVEKTISVEFNKLKGSENPIQDAQLDEKDYANIKPNLVETGRLVAKELYRKDSNIGILKHLGRGNATNQYGSLYGVRANDKTPKTDIGDGGAYNLSLKEAGGAQLMSPKGGESTGLVKSAIDRYSAAGGKVDASKALSLLSEELDNLAVKQMFITVGGGQKEKGAKDAFQNWYFTNREKELKKIHRRATPKQILDHMKAELSVHKITNTDKKYLDKLIDKKDALTDEQLQQKFKEFTKDGGVDLKGYIIPDSYYKSNQEKDLAYDNDFMREKVVEILNIAVGQKKFLDELTKEFTKNNELAKYIVYEAATGHAKFTGDVKGSPPYTGNVNAVAKMMMTYDKNTGGVELIDCWEWAQKNGSALTTNLNIDFKSSRTSRAGYTKFAVSIGKKVIPLMNSLYDKEYEKVAPILNEYYQEMYQLDEGLLDYVKKGYRNAVDAISKIKQKIVETLTKFLKALFKRFTNIVNNLFATGEIFKGIETLGLDFDTGNFEIINNV